MALIEGVELSACALCRQQVAQEQMPDGPPPVRHEFAGSRERAALERRISPPPVDINFRARTG